MQQPQEAGFQPRQADGNLQALAHLLALLRTQHPTIETVEDLFVLSENRFNRAQLRCARPQ